jgi:RNA recognition motif-containing protein
MSTKLCIKNLNKYTTEADLTDLFNHIGLVLSVSIPVDVKTGAHKGIGFVNMTEAGALEAIQSLNDSIFQESRISVSETEQSD